MKKIYFFILILPLVFLSACTLNKNNEQGSNNGSPLTAKTDILSNSLVNKSITSEKLGIEVSYYSSSTNEIFAKEDGSKIYFWKKTNQDDYKNGQSLEVFTKDKDISFEQAIADKFLTEQKYNNCDVNIIEDTVKYRKAIIDFKNSAKFPEKTNCINGDPSPSCDSCPAHYSKTNASLYFIYYKDHSDKFFYLDEGQESLIGDYDYYWYGNGNPREWFNNIEFVK